MPDEVSGCAVVAPIQDGTLRASDRRVPVRARSVELAGELGGCGDEGIQIGERRKNENSSENRRWKSDH